MVVGAGGEAFAGAGAAPAGAAVFGFDASGLDAGFDFDLPEDDLSGFIISDLSEDGLNIRVIQILALQPVEAMPNFRAFEFLAKLGIAIRQRRRSPRPTTQEWGEGQAEGHSQ
jgi:hypothetical protein